MEPLFEIFIRVEERMELLPIPVRVAYLLISTIIGVLIFQLSMKTTGFRIPGFFTAWMALIVEGAIISIFGVICFFAIGFFIGSSMVLSFGQTLLATIITSIFVCIFLRKLVLSSLVSGEVTIVQAGIQYSTQLILAIIVSAIMYVTVVPILISRFGAG